MTNVERLENKLLVTILVESGCLGPDGASKIENFCAFAENLFKTFGSTYIEWEFGPRIDKARPEISYKVNNRNLSHQQAAKYLDVFSLEINNFEEQLNDRITFIIEQYLNK